MEYFLTQVEENVVEKPWAGKQLSKLKGDAVKLGEKDRGKEEAWVTLSDAELMIGFKKQVSIDVTKEELKGENFVIRLLRLGNVTREIKNETYSYVSCVEGSVKLSAYDLFAENLLFLFLLKAFKDFF